MLIVSIDQATTSTKHIRVRGAPGIWPGFAFRAGRDLSIGISFDDCPRMNDSHYEPYCFVEP